MRQKLIRSLEIAADNSWLRMPHRSVSTLRSPPLPCIALICAVVTTVMPVVLVAAAMAGCGGYG
ncbi:hypothetical protein BZL29_5505 [Mycobacterium kansasii]|uniref:Uncharacterized protein n=1 Tax=Mycobacterium kansasii TaxID=1768 RepID=A0A1V3WVR7_MYCKA|nr:hypothetical protein BZL29_5505 [Mycobacterium kansasii]